MLVRNRAVRPWNARPGFVKLYACLLRMRSGSRAGVRYPPPPALKHRGRIAARVGRARTKAALRIEVHAIDAGIGFNEHGDLSFSVVVASWDAF